jgi:hypothetical protein
MKDFVDNTVSIISFALKDTNYSRFEELLSLQKIDEVERLYEEKQYLREQEELKIKIRKIRDKLNY